MADSKKLSFSTPPILNIFLWKFHGLVLGLAGLIDAKGIDVAQSIWLWGCPAIHSLEQFVQGSGLKGLIYNPGIKKSHQSWGPFNNYVNKMRGEGVKMSIRSGYKNFLCSQKMKRFYPFSCWLPPWKFCIKIIESIKWKSLDLENFESNHLDLHK